MRIAIFHNLHSGGSKRVLQELTRRLATRHRVDLYSPSCADNDYCDVSEFVNNSFIYEYTELPKLKSPFGRLNQGVRLLELVRLARLSSRIAAEIDHRIYDVVLVFPCIYTHSPMLLRYLRTPSVYYCPETFRMLHEPPVNRSPGREWLDGVDVLRRAYLRALKRVDKENLKRANLVLTNSCYTREAIYRVYGIFARVNLPGVDGEVFRPRGSEKGDYVLSVGALTPLKAHDFVVESVALIPTSLRPKVMIVGNYEEAGEREYLTRLAEEKGVELTIAVNVTDEELVELYNRARLTAYAPIMEPFGLVALESMACGTPVVGVREGGVRETVIDGETGILTDRDTSEFADAIRSLLEDEGLARRYGRQGRKLVLERWTWERSVEEIERHLKSSSSS